MSWTDGVRQLRRHCTRPPPPGPHEQRFQMMAAFVDQFESIAAAAHGCDVVLGATALQVATASVAEQARIPYVFAAYSPIVLPPQHHAPPPLPPLPGETPAPMSVDNEMLWARDADRFNTTFRAALNASRATRGLAPVEDVRRQMFTDRPLLAAEPTLAPWPGPTDAVVQTGAWLLADDGVLPIELETFLDAGDPPVYVGFGSTRASPDLGRVTIDAARRLGRRAVVSRGWAELTLADDQSDCFAVGEVNLSALFRRVVAVVHHGGAGTTTLAALSGVRQVVIPHVYDQHYWAQRVQQLGIGTVNAQGTVTAGSLTNALAEAMTSDVATRARSIAAHVSRDGARTAARHLVATGTARRHR